MSVRALAWAFEQPVDATAKLVLLALADHSSEDGDCWVGMRTLEAKTSLKERAIQTACRRLAAAGLICRSPRFQDGRQTTNLWQVVWRPAAKPQHPPAPNAPTPPHEMRGEGAPDAPPSPHQMRGKNHTDEPSVEPNNPPKPPKGGKARVREPFDPGMFDHLIPVELARSGEFVRTWHLWVEDRRERRMPMTDAAAKLQLKRLATEAATPEIAVAWTLHSMEAGWRAIYQPKGPPGPRARPTSPAFRSAADRALADQLARRTNARPNQADADPDW